MRAYLLVLHTCMFTLLLAAQHIHSNQSVTLKIGVIGSKFIDSKDTMVALELAERQLRLDQLLPPNIKLQIIKKNSCPFVGPAYEAADIAAKMRLLNGVDVIIGPPCSEGVSVTSQLAVHWNIPVIGFLSLSNMLVNKKRHKTLARVSLTTDKTGQATATVINHFGWKKVAIVVNLARNLTIYKYNSIVQELGNLGIQVTATANLGRKAHDKEIQSVLKVLRENARIIILVIGPSKLDETTQKFLLAAHHANMSGSDYVYFVPASYGTVEPISPKVFQPLRSVLLMYHRGYDASLLKDFVGDMAILGRNETETKTNTVSLLPLIRDSLYLYGLAVSKSYRKSGFEHIRNGTALWKLMTNVYFNGSSGPVKMDEKAERLPMFYISSIIKETGKWGVVMTVETNAQNVVVNHDDNFWRHEDLPNDTPHCGFNRELCENNYRVGVFVILTVFVLLSSGIILRFIKKRKEKRLSEMPWRIHSSSIEALKNLGSISVSRRCVESSHVNYKNSLLNSSANMAFIKGEMVIMYKHEQKRPVFFNKDELRQLNDLKSINHEYLNGFIGLCFNDKDSQLITCWCLKGRGTLKDILTNQDFSFENIFRRSFIRDINRGLDYIHHSSVGMHGNLNCINCLITNQWTVKLSNFGLNPTLRRLVQEQILQYEAENRHEMLHMAPEHLKERQREKVPIDPTREGDIYSFGTLIYGILFRTEPYNGNVAYQNDVINKFSDPRYRVIPPLEIPGFDENSRAFVNLLKVCLNGDPTQRPNTKEIHRVLENELKRERSVVDHMTMMMELHAENLEKLVKERTALLEEAQGRADTLLYQLLPRQVADSLKAGHVVNPQTFAAATVYFNDIMNFTKLCSESSPLEIVTFLNDLYSAFDSIIEQHDVYKVETVGDSYLIVSGVPEPNDNLHVVEIASMADQIRKTAASYAVPHKHGYDLIIRSGFHSGPVAAGVIGLKAPKYCLFGDTVNTASRMESTCVGMAIQTSEESKELLREYPQFVLEERGEISVKGKGLMKTYWLVKTETDLLPE